MLLASRSASAVPPLLPLTWRPASCSWRSRCAMSALHRCAHLTRPPVFYTLTSLLWRNLPRVWQGPWTPVAGVLTWLRLPPLQEERQRSGEEAGHSGRGGSAAGGTPGGLARAALRFFQQHGHLASCAVDLRCAPMTAPL